MDQQVGLAPAELMCPGRESPHGLLLTSFVLTLAGLLLFNRQAESLKYKLLGGLAVRRACYGVLRFIMESGAKGAEVRRSASVSLTWSIFGVCFCSGKTGILLAIHREYW